MRKRKSFLTFNYECLLMLPKSDAQWFFYNAKFEMGCPSFLAILVLDYPNNANSFRLFFCIFKSATQKYFFVLFILENHGISSKSIC